MKNWPGQAILHLCATKKSLARGVPPAKSGRMVNLYNASNDINARIAGSSSSPTTPTLAACPKYARLSSS
jgi:hypothetical protein